MTGEGDVAWYSESEGIAPGDLVLFRVAGDPMTRQKVYVGAVGECEATRQLFGNVPGPFLCWWQWNPHSLVIAPREDVTAHLCATHIWRRSTREAEQLFRFDTAPFTRPAETIMPVLDGATIDPVPLPAEFRAEYEAQLPTHATEEVN